MTERELSEKLSELAGKIEDISDSDDADWFIQLRDIAKEIRQLSNKKYTPGNVSWADVKQQVKNTKQSYTNKTGKRTPF